MENHSTKFSFFKYSILGRFGREFRSRPMVGRDRVFFLGRDPLSVAIGFFIWVATRGRSRPEFLSGSRPVLGRDRIFYPGRDRFLNFWVATGSGRDLRVDGPNHYLFAVILLRFV